MNKPPGQYFHLVFSLVMGAIMVFLRPFVITLVNIGLASDFIFRWMKAFAFAYLVAVPVIFFLAPLAKKIAARFAVMP